MHLLVIDNRCASPSDMAHHSIIPPPFTTQASIAHPLFPNLKLLILDVLSSLQYWLCCESFLPIFHCLWKMFPMNPFPAFDNTLIMPAIHDSVHYWPVLYEKPLFSITVLKPFHFKRQRCLETSTPHSP